MFQWFSAKSGGGYKTNNYPPQLQKRGAPFLRVLCARVGFTTACIHGNSRQTSKTFKRPRAPRKLILPMPCKYPIARSASLPTSRQVLPFPSPHREVTKAIYFLATLLLLV